MKELEAPSRVVENRFPTPMTHSTTHTQRNTTSHGSVCGRFMFVTTVNSCIIGYVEEPVSTVSFVFSLDYESDEL